MTSPARKAEIRCPACGVCYSSYIRASINLTLPERWTAADIEKMTTSVCPRCGYRVRHSALVVGEKGTWYVRRGDEPPDEQPTAPV